MNALQRMWSYQGIACASSWVGAVISVATGSSDTRPKVRTLGRVGLLGLLGAWLVLCAAVSAQAEPSEAKDATKTVVSKSVKGEIDLIASKFINLVYDRNREQGVEYEMELPYDAATLKLVNTRSLSDLHRGDTVSVMYDETSWMDEADLERKSRKATEVKLLKTAVKGLRSNE